MSHMLTFFAITVMLDLHTATDLIKTMIAELQEIFPGSVHLRAQRAMVYYHMRGESNPKKALTRRLPNSGEGVRCRATGRSVPHGGGRHLFEHAVRHGQACQARQAGS